MNVAASDVAMSLTGLIRGAGMISIRFIGVNPSTGRVTWFCEMYEELIQLISNSGVIVLLPLTIDRYIAVLFPLRHRYVMTSRLSRVITITSWLPIFCILVKDLVSYNILHSLKVTLHSLKVTLLCTSSLLYRVRSK